MNRILVCDDEKDIVRALEIYLKAEGYEVVTAYNGADALKRMKEDKEIRLVLLDIMMPEMDGIETLTKIREFSNVPVIFLTAKSEDTDKILGLNLGADDYITKPFLPAELTARVRSSLRRYTMLGSLSPEKDLLTVGSISLNDTAKEVRVDGDIVNLTKTEYEILRLLMTEPGRVFSPNEIYVKVWGEEPYGTENTVAVHIRRLREKIEIDPAKPRYLKVIWGQGYRMDSGIGQE
ncbi:MAG: response regulator transcription factor [Lachnospiraceae bacterium]|nr:response regulator transcription factor [Lachnospiraceae bacterium]